MNLAFCILLVSLFLVGSVHLLISLCFVKSKIKNIDDKFREIGFEVYRDNEYCVYLQRYNEEYQYWHIVFIAHKMSGKHIIQSYDRDTSKVVGLTTYEMELCVAKTKEKGWYSK